MNYTKPEFLCWYGLAVAGVAIRVRYYVCVMTEDGYLAVVRMFYLMSRGRTGILVWAVEYNVYNV